MDLPLYLTDSQIAKYLGYSVDWLKKNRDRLEREGFPSHDPLFRRTLRADIDAFLAKRRKVSDASDTAILPESDGVDYDKL